MLYDDTIQPSPSSAAVGLTNLIHGDVDEEQEKEILFCQTKHNPAVSNV